MRRTFGGEIRCGLPVEVRQSPDPKEVTGEGRRRVRTGGIKGSLTQRPVAIRALGWRLRVVVMLICRFEGL
jgi:hypothetical protein